MPYQSTHNTGGTDHGQRSEDQRGQPLSAVVGRAELCSSSALGVFPQNAGYNPTGPVGALAYWTADAIINKYLKSPGPLVQA